MSPAHITILVDIMMGNTDCTLHSHRSFVNPAPEAPVPLSWVMGHVVEVLPAPQVVLVLEKFRKRGIHHFIAPSFSHFTLWYFTGGELFTNKVRSSTSKKMKTRFIAVASDTRNISKVGLCCCRGICRFPQ